MASKKPDQDVLDLLESLDNTSAPSKKESDSSTPAKVESKSKDDDDIMGFLDSLTDTKSKAPKKTEEVMSSVASSKPVSTADASKLESEPQSQPPKEPSVTATPTLPATTQTQQHNEPIEDKNAQDTIASLSSWWQKSKSGLWDSATSAVKQAEAKVREIQPDVLQTQKHALESLNGSISKLKLNSNILQSTLSSVLETIAPPISRHEQLQIYMFHDMIGYSSIDDIVYSVFERVMQQVEGGGSLSMTVQKGKEHHINKPVSDKRELNIFKGPIEHARKLAAASIDEFLRSELYQQKKKDAGKTAVSVDEEGRISKVHEDQENESKARVSSICLSIQPSSTEPTSTQEETNFISSSSAQTFQFVIYLKDPDHNIEISTVSQSFPIQWAKWLDSSDDQLDLNSVDPREWVIDWIEEGLGLSIGVLAQSYVCNRMGIDDTTASKPDSQ